MAKILDWFFKAVDMVTIVLLIAMVAFVFLQVICRFLNISTPWTDEMARFCFIYITFLGSITATKNENNIVIDVLLEHFNYRIKNFVKAVIYVGVATFLIVFSRGAYATILTSGDVPSASLYWFKHSYIYMAVLFSTVVMILICAVHVARCMRAAFGKEAER